MENFTFAILAFLVQFTAAVKSKKDNDENSGLTGDELIGLIFGAYGVAGICCCCVLSIKKGCAPCNTTERKKKKIKIDFSARGAQQDFDRVGMPNELMAGKMVHHSVTVTEPENSQQLGLQLSY